MSALVLRLVSRRWPVVGAALLLATVYAQARAPGGQTTPAKQFEEAVTLVDGRNDCAAAIPLFERVAESPERPLAARALVYLGACYERLGNERARQAYRRVVAQFSEQRAPAAQARARLAALDRAARKADRLTLRPLWTGSPDLEVGGRPSIDGRVLPMLDEQGRLVLTDIDLGHRRPPLPLGAPSDGLPTCVVQSLVAIAPGAREAAFSCEVSADRHDFRVIRIDGAQARQRRLAVEHLEPLEWSQPGVILVERTAGGGRALAVINALTGQMRDVTPLRAPVDAASVSPDGAWIAFDGPDASGRRDVFVVAARGGSPVGIGIGSSDDLLPGWTPDGRGVLFISDRTGSPGLWLQPVIAGAPTGAPQLLSQDLGRVADVWAATRNGEFIYFRQTGLVKVAIATLDETGQVVGAPSVSGTGQLGGTMMPTWAPDGHRLAYQTTLTGSRLLALGIRDVETADEHLLATGLRYFSNPRWSPDGRHIAVRGTDSEGHNGIFLIDPDTGRHSPLKLMPHMDEDTLGPSRWAPDGALIARVRDAFVRIDIVTGAEQPLFVVEGGTTGFAVSPTDGTIAFLHVAGAAMSLDVRHTDGSTGVLLRAGPSEYFGSLAWMPDGRTLVVTRVPTNPALSGEARWPSVWRIDSASGVATPLGLTMDRLRDLAVSPDGRRLAFTTGAPSREPWVLENFLPRTPNAGRVPR